MNKAAESKVDAKGSGADPKASERAAGSGARTEKPAGSGAGAAKTSGETKPGAVREKAAVGAGEKGRGYGGDMVTMPLATIWTVKEKLLYEQIDDGMKLYKASEGHAPKTHEEFMDKIIKARNLKLPDLPAGHRYVYDPSVEKLMIERPNDL